MKSLPKLLCGGLIVSMMVWILSCKSWLPEASTAETWKNFSYKEKERDNHLKPISKEKIAPSADQVMHSYICVFYNFNKKKSFNATDKRALFPDI